MRRASSARHARRRSPPSRGPADLIVGNNVLAHVPDLNDFVARPADPARSRGGVVTMEFPHLLRLMRGQPVRHDLPRALLVLLVLDGRARSSRRTACALFDVEELPTHGGSLRIYRLPRRTTTARRTPARARRLRRREEARRLPTARALRARSAAQVEETKRALLEFLIEARARRARRSSATARPARATRCSTTAASERTSSTTRSTATRTSTDGSCPARTSRSSRPRRIRETRPDYVLILPWNLKDEIIEQLAYVRDWGGRFVVPIPRVTVLS